MNDEIEALRRSRVGQTLNGKWHLDALLGEGGMGEVYVATHRNGSRCAVKILRKSVSHTPGVKSRFMREGYIANAIDHPGVVRVLDDDVTSDGMPFIAMELLEGQSLHERVVTGKGRLPVDETLRIAEALLDVLVAAHAKKILHRDLKPENVFLTRDDRVKVLDFGLAKVWSEGGPSARHTVFGRLMGTPGYMSPEQSCGHWDRVDETTDLWALGATMHFCLTGLAVHDSEDSQQTVELTTTKAPPSVATLAPGLPRDVVALIDRAVAFERANRWGSAVELLARVRELRRGASRTSETSVAAPGARSRAESLAPRLVADAPATTRTPPRAAVTPRPAPAPTPTPAPAYTATPSRATKAAAARGGALEPVEFAPDTWWVGKREPGSIFHANPYLRVYRSEDSTSAFPMLIDPGSSSDLAVVLSKVTAVLGSPSQLEGLFVNHQDPDVGSSASVLCARYAPRARIFASEATWRLIVHFGLPRDRFVDTEKYPHGFVLPTGHSVLPVPSPFCHFRGAVMLYDPETRVLFTGDLFGGLTPQDAEGLWADERDWSGLRAFHQMYMPSNRAIAPVIRAIRALDPPVEVIAPQHGRLLRGDVLEAFMARLEKLPVGMDLLEEEQSPDVLAAWNSVLQRVVHTAEMLLGHEVREQLLTSPSLHDVLVVENGRISAGSLGRWAVGVAVNELTAGQPPSVANPIKIEAILAAEELNLPSPDLHIDDAEGGDALRSP